jgi:hypothetical protein
MNEITCATQAVILRSPQITFGENPIKMDVSCHEL